MEWPQVYNHYSAEHYAGIILEQNKSDTTCSQCNQKYNKPDRLAVHIGVSHKVVEQFIFNIKKEECPDGKNDIKHGSIELTAYENSDDESFEENKLSEDCSFCFSKIFFKSELDLQDHFIRHIQDKLIISNNGNVSECYFCKKKYVGHKKNLLLHLAKDHNKAEGLIPNNLHKYFTVNEKNKTDEVMQILEMVGLKDYEGVQTYKRKDRKLSFYSICPWCLRLNLSIDKISILRHFAMHFKDKILADIKDGQCSKCDLKYKELNKVICHLALTHNLLKTLADGQNIDIEEIPGTRKVDNVSLNNLKENASVNNTTIHSKESNSATKFSNNTGDKEKAKDQRNIQNSDSKIALVNNGDSNTDGEKVKEENAANDQNFNNKKDKVQNSDAKEMASKSPVKVGKDSLKDREEKLRIKTLLEEIDITGFSDIILYSRKDVEIRVYSICPWCNSLVAATEKSSIKKHFANHCKTQILADQKSDDKCFMCEKDTQNKTTLLNHLAFHHNLLTKYSSDKCIDIFDIPEKHSNMKPSSRDSKSTLHLNKIKQVKDICKNTISTQDKNGTKCVAAENGFSKTALSQNETKVNMESKIKVENVRVENAKLVERLKIPSTCTEISYINLISISKYYIICPVCHKLLTSPDIRSLKQHYVIHFKSLILKEIGDDVTKCNKCNLSFPREIQKAQHFGIMHGMLDKFIHKEGYQIMNLDEDTLNKSSIDDTSKAVRGTERTTDKPLPTTSNDVLSQIIKFNNLTINKITEETPVSNTNETSNIIRSSVIKSITEVKLNPPSKVSENFVERNIKELDTDVCKQNEFKATIVENTTEIRKTVKNKVKI